MKGLFRSLIPRRQKHFILARAATEADARPDADVHAAAVIEPLPASDEPALDRFCTTAGFPDGWTRDMLRLGAAPTIARNAPAGDIVAMAWHTHQPFYVAEIDTLFDPASGVYLFGDYVAPAFRGRKLQRLLVHHRLAAAAKNATPIAFTIIEADNGPSLASYRSHGFIATTSLTRTRWLGRTRDHISPIPTPASHRALPSFELNGAGAQRRLQPRIP